jgi:ABC-type oligopeptide transport system ATPase subunit
MHGGRIVERGPADDVILRPEHPYTRQLASAAPNPEARFSQ